jgi:DNA (cytosine-5)-methyltransferase 1
MMRVLDLFSGIGGFSLGLERAGMETVAFCEIEEYPRKVLRKHWPDVPIFEDVRKLKGEDVEPIDLICGGYPCQPFSTAGKRRGQEDDRHLWPEFNRLIRELRPKYVICENVAGHVSMGLDDVLSDLEGQGYTAETFIIPACAVDAPHRRDRVWIVADTSSKRSQGVCDLGESQQETRTPKREEIARSISDSEPGGCRWAVEPGVGRVANGIPSRVDRLKGLGNAVVPQIPEIIGRAIMRVDKEKPEMLGKSG